MKNILYILTSVTFMVFLSCQPQVDPIGEIGSGPANGSITVDGSDPYNPVFTATAEKGFVYHWDLGNNQVAEGQTVTSYYPFSGDYSVVCTIAGAGGVSVKASQTYNVAVTDPNVANQPVWKELTGGGAGKTWVYNTDLATGSPDYCFQTYNDDEYDYGDGSRCWAPKNSWGQCVRITPDINGEMVFDLNGGINYTYHQVGGDAGVQGNFILDTENMTLTIVTPYILDYAIDCTFPEVTVTGVYDIKHLTDDEMILWQKQEEIAWGTGWAWSFKRKGS